MEKNVILNGKNKKKGHWSFKNGHKKIKIFHKKTHKNPNIVEIRQKKLYNEKSYIVETK